MNINLVRSALFFGCLILLASATALAQSDDANFTLSTGVGFTSGTYGGDEDIEDLYVPVTGSVYLGKVAFRLTVPYVSVRAPEGTVIGPDGQPVPGSGVITTESGLGDIIGGVTVFDVINSRRLGFVMDLTGKIKFGTADVDKRLGTGENDYSVQADFYKFAGQFTLMGSVGYRLRGAPADVELNDVLLASIGGTYRVSPETSFGLSFDYRESAIPDYASIQELTGFVSRRIGESWAIQMYAFTGFSDSSPDLGIGFSVSRAL